MTLGENIARLRAQKGWSQGDLADALNVSRQSISKWETDSSIPELDRLVQLSGLFGISLDELVRGEDAVPAASATAASVPAPPQNRWADGRLTAGIIMPAVGCFLFLLGLLLGGMVAAVLAFVAPPLIVCGIVCLTAKRRVLLKCAWAAYLTLDLTARIFTGIGWQSLPGFLRFLPRGDLVRLRTMPPQVTIAALQLIGLLLLIVFTVRVFRGAAYAPSPSSLHCLQIH